MANQRDTKSGGGRKAIPQRVRLEVWVRSGGRCAICNGYLLDGAMTERTIHLGELAHIVGQQQTAGSPRGSHELDERDAADNLMLVCADEHDEIDARETLSVFTVDKLRELKRAHEDRIRHVTGLVGDRTTTVVRMVGRVRGQAVELARETAAAAVIASANRFPLFLESYSRHGIEIELRHVPGEALIDLRGVDGEEVADPDYYRAATNLVDNVIDHQLNQGIVRDKVAHLSIFGFARLPLLVYLGSRLDDTVPTDVYQRHRHDETWVWSESAPIADFEAQVERNGTKADEGVLVLNISGTIQPSEIPTAVAELPRYRVAVLDVPAAPDVMRHRDSLTHFQDCLRGLFADVEATAKHIRRLHVLPALPLSAAVALGRVHDRQVHPSLKIYDRTDHGYYPALEIK